MTGTRRPHVVVYRQEHGKPSETFVRDHVRTLSRYRPTLLTSRLAEDAVSNGPATGGAVVAGSQLRDRVVRRLAHRKDTLALHEAELRRSLQRLRPDLLHVHFGTDASVIVRAARSLGLPMVVTWHGYDATRVPEALQQSVAGRLLLERRSEVLAGSRRTIAVSRYIAERLLAEQADAERLRVVPCGVDTEAFACAPPAPAGNLLFVGRLVAKKGLSDLLEALAGLAGAPPLDVVGAGPLREALEQQASRLGVDARFHAAQAPGRVQELMAQARIVVLPSKRAADGDCEGMPVVSVEAAATGRPVIAYAHSGLVDSIEDHRTGLLVPEGDVAALREALSTLLPDPALQAAMGRAARARAVEHFDLRRTTARIEDVYDEALGT